MNYSVEKIVEMLYIIGEDRMDCFQKCKERFKRTTNANYEKTTIALEALNKMRLT